MKFIVRILENISMPLEHWRYLVYLSTLEMSGIFNMWTAWSVSLYFKPISHNCSKEYIPEGMIASKR